MKDRVLSFVNGVLATTTMLAIGWAFLKTVLIGKVLMRLPFISVEMLSLAAVPLTVAAASYGTARIVKKGIREFSEGASRLAFYATLLVGAGEVSLKKMNPSSPVGGLVHGITYFVEKEAVPGFKSLPGIRNLFDEKAAPASEKKHAPAAHRRAAPKKVQKEEVPLYYQPADY